MATTIRAPSRPNYCDRCGSVVLSDDQVRRIECDTNRAIHNSMYWCGSCHRSADHWKPRWGKTFEERYPHG